MIAYKFEDDFDSVCETKTLKKKKKKGGPMPTWEWSPLKWKNFSTSGNQIRGARLLRFAASSSFSLYFDPTFQVLSASTRA